MSGHNKWSKIKRAKAVTDTKKSKIFSKLSNTITTATKQGGGDPKTNPSLRLAIEKAKAARLPKENIRRAIKKGLGTSADSNFQEVTYEGFGPMGVAFLIEGTTDNKNRTVAELRKILNKYGASFSGAGSTSHIFSSDNNAPTYEVEVAEKNSSDLKNLIQDLENHEDVKQVYTNLKLLPEV